MKIEIEVTTPFKIWYRQTGLRYVMAAFREREEAEEYYEGLRVERGEDVGYELWDGRRKMIAEKGPRS